MTAAAASPSASDDAPAQASSTATGSARSTGSTDGAVWVDGTVMTPGEAKVSVFDHGFTVGDGVFETLKVIDGRPFALRRHLERLDRSATGLGLDVPLSRPRLTAAIDETLSAAGPSAGRVRITLTGGMAPLGSGRGSAGPTLVIAVGRQEPWEPDTTAVTVPWPRNERAATTGLKTTSYAENVMALAEAHKAGATEAVFANLAGNLCEGTGTNVFAFLDGRLVTPPLLAGCLAGVTRALVLELLDDAEEDNLPIGELARADEVLLTSSTRDVHPLRNLDGRPLPGVAGPVAQRATQAVTNLQSRDLDP
jgi:branched-chain amino acid aminotransferase